MSKEVLSHRNQGGHCKVSS